MEKLKGAVNWIKEYESGLDRSKNEQKPLLLDFFKDG
jgi:hypothetical protein